MGLLPAGKAGSHLPSLEYSARATVFPLETPLLALGGESNAQEREAPQHGLKAFVKVQDNFCLLSCPQMYIGRGRWVGVRCFCYF
jgi:hypothetical protein